MGYTNLPARLAVDTSSLYARNLFNFVSLIVDKKTGALALNWDDEIVKGAGLTRDGAIVHPALKGDRWMAIERVASTSISILPPGSVVGER